jgi:REP element-mobilizing transposase RayT
LERTRRNYRLVVLGYVVMPEHVHLLVSEPQRKTLSIAVQALKIGFVRRLEGIDNRSVAGVPRSRKNSETWGTLGGETRVTAKPFWQARFYDFNVFTEEKRIRETALHPSQSGRAWIGVIARPLAMEQFPLVPLRRSRPSANQRHGHHGDDYS